MKSTRAAFLGGAAAAGCALAAKPAVAQFAPQPGQQVFIAVCAPLSGDRAEEGRQLVAGVQIACDYANRLATALDKFYLPRQFDDRDSLASAITAAQFSCADPNVVATVGHLSGDITLGVLQTYANGRMPLLVPASTLDAITTRGYRNVFRLPTRDAFEGALFGRAVLTSSSPPRRVVGIIQNASYGKAVLDGFTGSLAASKLGVQTVVLPSYNIPFGDAAKRIVALQPDYIFFAASSDDVGALMPALRAAGYKGRFGASQGFFNGTTLEKYAEAFGKGSWVSTSMPPVERNGLQSLQYTDLLNRVGTITPLMAFGYAAAQIVIGVMRRTMANNRLSIITNLTTSGFYDTLVGAFQFSLTGDPLDPNLYFYTIDGGKFKFQMSSHPSSFLS